MSWIKNIFKKAEQRSVDWHLHDPEVAPGHLIVAPWLNPTRKVAKIQRTNITSTENTVQNCAHEKHGNFSTPNIYYSKVRHTQLQCPVLKNYWWLKKGLLVASFSVMCDLVIYYHLISSSKSISLKHNGERNWRVFVKHGYQFWF